MTTGLDAGGLDADGLGADGLDVDGLDADRIAAAVAGAVGLAEGPAGVRAVIRAVAAGAGSTRAVGRAAGLPLPLVAAVCGELRGRGVLTADRPARLTAAGSAAFGAPATLSAADEAGLAAELEAAAAAVPPVRVELDQTHCTVRTKVRRVMAMHAAGAVAGRRVLVLGDDDLVSVALARLAARHGVAPASLTVVEVDPALVGYLREQLAGAPFPVSVLEHDLRAPLPLDGPFDTVQTDPPYTVDGAALFLERAAVVLRPGADVFLSLGVRRPAETVRLQEVLVRLGLAVRAMTPGFNEYVGAGVLGGTSALWQLVVAGPEPVPPGSVYTGAGRARRRYACTACGAVQTIGEGRRWRTVGELKEAGCPRCGGRTFRPRSRPGREAAGAR
jgi:predicted methyltransferase